MKEKQKIPQMPFSYKFIPIYMVIIISIFCLSLSKITIKTDLTNIGVVKKYKVDNIQYSDYEGLVSNVFIKEGQKVKQGDLMFVIKIKDPDKIKRENRVDYIKKSIKMSTEDNEKKELLDELKILETINDKREIYSDFNGTVDKINIRKGQSIVENEKLISIQEYENNLYYVEGFFKTKDILKLKEEDNVNLKFIGTDDVSIYNGVIDKIYLNDIINKDNEILYNARIRIVSRPSLLIEGIEAQISIKKSETTLLQWIISD